MQYSIQSCFSFHCENTSPTASFSFIHITFQCITYSMSILCHEFKKVLLLRSLKPCSEKKYKQTDSLADIWLWCKFISLSFSLSCMFVCLNSKRWWFLPFSLLLQENYYYWRYCRSYDCFFSQVMRKWKEWVREWLCWRERVREWERTSVNNHNVYFATLQIKALLVISEKSIFWAVVYWFVLGMTV